MTLKRYERGDDHGMLEDPDGEYVRLADVQALFTAEDVDMLENAASGRPAYQYGTLARLAVLIAGFLKEKTTP